MLSNFLIEMFVNMFYSERDTNGTEIQMEIFMILRDQY